MRAYSVGNRPIPSLENLGVKKNMADITFQYLDNALPTGAVTASADDVVISVKTLIGEATVGLNDEKVSEFVSKLLSACAEGQSAFNATSPPNTITSYPSPTLGAPRQLPTGNTVTSRTHTVTVVAPVSLDDISANIA